jgi:hypothetical protein
VRLKKRMPRGQDAGAVEIRMNDDNRSYSTMKTLFITIILLPILLTSCDFKNPLESLKPKDNRVEYENKLTQPLYSCDVPGVPVWTGKRFGGMYTKHTPEEVKAMVGVPNIPPDPRYEIKAWITLLAKIASGLGLLGMLIGAVLFVYQNPAWDDVAIVAAVSFSGGLTVAVSYNLIVIVIPTLTLCAVGYFGYVIYQKHSKQKVTDEMLDMCDLLTGVVDESPEVVTTLKAAGVVSDKVEKHIQKSVKRRNGTREKKLKEAKELLSTTG